jgi:hypothetical protein
LFADEEANPKPAYNFVVVPTSSSISSQISSFIIVNKQQTANSQPKTKNQKIPLMDGWMDGWMGGRTFAPTSERFCSCFAFHFVLV